MSILMSSAIVASLLKRIGQPDLLDVLSQELSGTELNSLLLEVFNHRSAALTPSDLLNLYQLNRFVKPSDLPVMELKRMELDVLEIFQKHFYQPIELSPVAALGSCSVVGTVDQKKILTALRGTEVLADATNAIALHICDLKQRKVWIPEKPTSKIRFGTIQRHVRTQQIAGKGFTPHFKIGCLVTAGYDSGSFTFEMESLCEHITIMKTLYLNYYKVEDLRFRFLCCAGYPRSQELARQVRAFVLQQHPEVIIHIVDQPEQAIGYYKGIQYKIDIRLDGKEFEIGDGGFVDWTQQLLQSRKERMLITGIGFDFMYRILNRQL